ncbi:MAG: hypothetical protein DRQ40_04480 [Gammaproteobacteria bacterium]|nr:MAG: hypothetical protein DRQ40_04480 [Gammaproteobacteria bacterium]
MSEQDSTSHKVHVMWEPEGGLVHRGELVRLDYNKLVVRCSDGECRVVEDNGEVSICCPSCQGSGRYSVPSDGYENSRSGRCSDCRGEGSLSSFARIALGELVSRRDKLKSAKKKIDEELLYSDRWIRYAQACTDATIRGALGASATPIQTLVIGGELEVPSITFVENTPGFSRGRYTGLHCEFCSQPAYETQGGYELCCTHAVMFGSRAEWGGLKSLPPRVGPPDREMK